MFKILFLKITFKNYYGDYIYEFVIPRGNEE